MIEKKKIKNPIDDLKYGTYDPSVSKPIVTYADFANMLLNETDGGKPGGESDRVNGYLVDEINAIRDRDIKYAEQYRQDAYDAAERNREKALVDAETSYAKNRSTYGAKAEALASMGLTGSGYSDYIDAQNYARYRDEVRQANETRQTAIDTADRETNDMLYSANARADEQIVAAKREADLLYADVLGGAQSGEYSKEVLTEIADRYGYDKTALLNAANTAQLDTMINEVRNGSFYNFADLDSKVASGSLDETVAESVKAEQNRSVYNNLVDALNTGDVATIAEASANLDVLLREKYIDEPTYNEMQKLLNESKQGLNYKLSTNAITDDEYINKIGSNVSGTTVEGGWKVRRFDGFKNDDIWLDIGGTEYDVTLSEVQDDNLSKQLNKIATGSENTSPDTTIVSTRFNSDEYKNAVVMYNGKLYIFTPNKSSNSWKEIVGKDAVKARLAWINGQKTEKFTGKGK